MQLLLDEHRKAMLANARANAGGEDPIDCQPVVKLFVPWGGATWLLTELDPEEPDIAFGLCDLGMQSPELGYVSLAEITSIRGPGGLTIERDLYFTAKKTLSEYAADATRAGRIVT